MDVLQHFNEVWLCSTVCTPQAGERPSLVCLVARKYRTDHCIRLWQDDLRATRVPPFPVNSGSLLVTYSASTQLGCFQALGWPMPTRVLDLACEFRRHKCGLPVDCGYGLLGALIAYRLGGFTSTEKGMKWKSEQLGELNSPDNRQAILDFCQSDVDAIARLLPAMIGNIDLPRALFRGRYMQAVARMEWHGIPLDTEALGLLRVNWPFIQNRLIERVDRDFGVYVRRTFKADLFKAWLAAKNIKWPERSPGVLALDDDDTFKEMARTFSAVMPLKELRTTLNQLRLHQLAVGSDGRNRCSLCPFSSKTGRNQPSTSEFIFGPSTWVRSLIRPGPGMALAYIDWSQQELGIAAALSGDRAMRDAYQSGDFYLHFAKMARAVPRGATKESYAFIRDQFKTAALGVLNGLSAPGLANRLGVPHDRAEELLHLHRTVFRQFWKWSDGVQDEAMLTGQLQTVFGWRCHTGEQPNLLSLRNFPMQGNGAEMLRLACCLATERGIGVCCPIHDALLIEASPDAIEAQVEATQ